LPRSGNTLLSSILNQHPKIYSSPLSPLRTYLGFLNNEFLYHEANIICDNSDRTTRLINELFPTYYKDIEKPIIFDRNKSWGTPGNLNLIKQCLNEKPKIVFTVRPIIEILTSFTLMFKDYPVIDEMMKSSNWDYNYSLSENDNKCDFLMREGGDFDRLMLTFNEIKNIDNSDIFYIVRYDDLVLNPKKTLEGIYDFISLEHFEHDFNNIERLETYYDDRVGAPSYTHKVKKTLQKTDIKPEQALSDYILSKYSKIDLV
jgi:hypothetical protein